MRKPQKITINENVSLKIALKKLNTAQEKLLICVNNNNKFVGVINDGDIRRSLINNEINVNTSIKNLINRKSTKIYKDASLNYAQNLLGSKVTILPVIDKNNNVIGYYSLKDFIRKFDKKVTIVGLGYVGFTLTLSMINNGFEVNGFDSNKNLIKNLKKGKLHFFEKDLDKHLLKNKKLINVSSSLEKCKSDCYILTVGTPIENKKPVLKQIEKSIIEICKVLKEGDLIILRSTLPINTTNDFIIPFIKKKKNFVPGEDYFISFAPERTVEGNALYELENNPQIIGADDLVSFEKTSNIFNKLTTSIIKVDNIKSAEFAKLVDNSYRDHKFSYPNQLIEPCEKLKINLNAIIDAVNFGYGRNDIAKPSPGVGGPCLTKDPFIFYGGLKKYSKNLLIDKVRNVNNKIPDYVYKKIIRLIKKEGLSLAKIKILFLGLAFKGEPETSDTRESSSLKIINKFSNFKNIVCYDPVLKKKDVEKLNLNYTSINNGFKNASLVVFLNNHKSFEKLNIETLVKKMKKPAIIIDTWNQIDKSKFDKLQNVRYSGLGND
jgi:UDP-N-acetyl-D-mannosaminuronic acid dehydrogenase